MGRKKKSGPTPVVQFRLQQDTLDDLESVAESLSVSTGVRYTRADAVRYLARQGVRVGFNVLGDLTADGVVQQPPSTLGVPGLFPSDTVIYHVRCHGLEEIHCVEGDYLLIRPVAPLDGDVVIVYVQSQGLMCRRIDTQRNILYALDRRKWSHTLTPDDTVLGVYLGVIRKG